MGTLPRKMNFEKIIGYVHCDRFGFFPCEDNSDKEKLIALLQIYMKGLENGSIVMEEGELPQFRDYRIPEKYKKSLKTLSLHLNLNFKMLIFHFPGKVIRFLDSLLGSKVSFVSNKKLHKLLKGKLFHSVNNSV